MRTERQIEILNLLRTNGVAEISVLSGRFAVSQNTIRRDLRSLAEQGLLTLTHGGAVYNRNIPMGIPLGEREDRFAEEKLRIGRKAAEFIGDGEAVILDAGTTTERIIPFLVDKRNLTVVTNGLNIAESLMGIPGVTSILVGGIVNETTRCTAGFHAEEFIRQFHVSTAFISAGGVERNGVTNTNVFEVEIKRSMIRSAAKVVLVATHDKIGTVSLAPFAGLEEVDALVTDVEADEKALAPIRERGVEVYLC